MEGFTTTDLSEVADKFSLILAAWIVGEVDEGDVTVWEENGASPLYITFEPVAFKFLLRKPGDKITPMESVVGIQMIDLISLRERAENLADQTLSGSDFEIDEVYSQLYLSEVLRYWMYIAGTNLIIESALMMLCGDGRHDCVDKISRAYEYFTSNKNKGKLAKRIMETKSQVVKEELYEFGEIGLH